MVGTTQASVSNYESGKRDVPLWIAVSMARSLGVTTVELIPAFDNLTRKGD